MSASGVFERGVDTARVLIPVDGLREDRRAKEALGMRGKPDGLSGLQAGYMPGIWAVWVEGRFVRTQDEESTELLPAALLPDATEQIRTVLSNEYGIGSMGKPKFSRIDLTASVRLDKPADGFAVLRGVNGLQIPRRTNALYHRHGKPQTVSFVTSKGERKETVYDKGAESLAEAAGLIVRFETRNRIAKPERETAATWTADHCADQFEWKMKEMNKAADGQMVASESAVRDAIKNFVDESKITSRQAELLLGHIGAESVGIETHPKTAQRRRAELRRLGLALALDGAEESTSVDLGAILEEVVGARDW